MRTLNIRLAIVLLVISIVFGGGAYLLHGFQIEKNAYVFLEQADNAEIKAEAAGEKGNTWLKQESMKEAIQSLKWYVRLMPDDVEVRERLGLLYADWSKDRDADDKDRRFLAGQAWGHLERVVALNPDRETARRKLVEMGIEGRRYQNAKDHLQMTLLQRHPDDAELWEQLAICQSRMGEHDKAKKSYEKAIECESDRVAAYFQLAILLRSRFSQPEEADQLMEKLVEVNPDSAQAHFLWAQYLYYTGLRDEALLEVTKALELDPRDIATLFLAAKCNRIKGNLDEARRCLSEGIKLRPDAFMLYVTQADIETRSGNRDEALVLLERGLLNTGRDARILYEMANLQINMGKLDEAEKIIAELKTTNLQRPKIIYLKARIEYVQEHWLAARKGFENIQGSRYVENEASKIDLWIGECYGRLGNREMQKKIWQKAKIANPANKAVIAKLINLDMASGKVDEAMAGIRELAESHQVVPGSVLVYARMLLMKNLRLPPEKRDWEAFNKTLDAAEKAVPDSTLIAIFRAKALVAQNRTDEAEKLLREARDKNPDQVAYWRSLAGLAYRNEDWEQAEKILDDTEKKFGDTPEQRIARAQHLLRRKGLEAGDGLRKLAENIEPYTDEQRLALWNGLLGGARRINDEQFVDSLCGKILEKQPDNVGIHFLLFDMALSSRDWPEMEKTLKEIERIAGQCSYWLMGQSILLYINATEEKDEKTREAALTQALKMLAEARELREEWARIPLIEAGVYDALGKYDLSLEKYRQAFDMGERNPNGVIRMVKLLLRSRQYTEADHILRQIESERGELPIDLSRIGAELALRQGDNKRALELARNGSVPDSDKSLDHLWQGNIFGILGSNAKASNEDNAAELLADAEKAYRRAVELEPKLSRTWTPLIRFLGIIGEMNKAEKAIEEAKKALPENVLPLVLAPCLEAMGKSEEAEKQYEEAVAVAPKDVGVAKVVAAFYARIGKLPQAEAQLQKIIDGKVDGEPADTAWARRQLAQVYAVRGGYKYFQNARKLIEENLASPEASVQDRQFMARLNAMDPKATMREQARDSFEKMLDEQAASPQDQLALAKMYESAGEWIKAGNIIRELITTYPQEPRYLVVYIQTLLRHGEISSIEMYLDRLQGIAPDWFVTLALRTDMLCAKNQPQKAFDLLKKYADESASQSNDSDARFRLAADKLNQLAQTLTKPEQKPIADKFFKQAETYLREYVKNDPARNLRLTVFLGARGEMDEAIDLLEKSLDLNKPSDFSRASILLSHNTMSEQQAKRLDAVIEKGVEKYERHAALLQALAEIRTRQTRYNETEALYREVLASNPDNAVAMNNLAVLLALQGIKLDESLELVSKAIEIAGPLGSMLDSRASVYLAIGEPEKALADLADAIADSESPVRLFHQAQAFHKAGKIEEAKIAMQKALAKNLAPEMLQPLEVPAFEKLRETLQ